MVFMARTKKHYARREQLIDAATRAISERGRDNVRVRDIAEFAGVSAGSVLYHYPELSELIFDVHRSVVERFYRRRAEQVESHQAPANRLVAAIETGLPTGRDDDVAKTLYAMHALADRSSPHGALMSSLFDREVSLYTTVLEIGRACGDFRLTQPVADVARTLVVLEDGLGLHLISNNMSLDLASARGLLLAYANQAIDFDLPALTTG